MMLWVKMEIIALLVRLIRLYELIPDQLIMV